MREAERGALLAIPNHTADAEQDETGKKTKADEADGGKPQQQPPVDERRAGDARVGDALRLSGRRGLRSVGAQHLDGLGGDPPELLTFPHISADKEDRLLFLPELERADLLLFRSQRIVDTARGFVREHGEGEQRPTAVER